MRQMDFDAFLTSIEAPALRIALPLASDGRTGDGIVGASWFLDPYLEGPIELMAENESWCPLQGS